MGRVEAGVPLGQGEGAIPGDGPAFLHFGGFQRFGGEALHGVAVQVFDAHIAVLLPGSVRFPTSGDKAPLAASKRGGCRAGRLREGHADGFREIH